MTRRSPISVRWRSLPWKSWNTAGKRANCPSISPSCRRSRWPNSITGRSCMKSLPTDSGFLRIPVKGKSPPPMISAIPIRSGCGNKVFHFGALTVPSTYGSFSGRSQVEPGCLPGGQGTRRIFPSLSVCLDTARQTARLPSGRT